MENVTSKIDIVKYLSHPLTLWLTGNEAPEIQKLLADIGIEIGICDLISALVAAGWKTRMDWQPFPQDAEIREFYRYIHPSW